MAVGEQCCVDLSEQSTPPWLSFCALTSLSPEAILGVVGP